MILFLEIILDENGANWCHWLEPSYTSLQVVLRETNYISSILYPIPRLS